MLAKRSDIAPQCRAKVLTAQRHITIISTDFGLFTLFNRLTQGIHPQVHGGFAPTPAHGLQLHQSISNPPKSRGAGEELALEVCSKAIAQHRNLVLVSQSGKLRARL